MAEVLQSPSHFSSSPRRTLSCDLNDASNGLLSPSNSGGEGAEKEEEERRSGAGGAIERKRGRNRRGRGGGAEVEIEGEEERQQLSVLALLLTVHRKSLLRCKTEGAGDEDFGSMDIGWPTDVRHVAHVTFDRFHGFLGLPVEFEPEVPRRAPSASTTVFGVSTESMQCSYDRRGNSVPTILLLMQRRLYEQGGLRAWFRELPTGVLDSLSSEQMADPLTALMYAVQVMNFLRMLILRTLKERRESAVEDAAVSGADPSDEDGHQSPQMHLAACSEEATERAHVAEEAVSDSLPRIATEEEEEEEAARSSHDDAAFFSENAAGSSTGHEVVASAPKSVHTKTGRPNSQNHRKGRKAKRESTDRASLPAEKLKGSSIVSRINSKIEGVEAWR
ncbi:rhoGAP domain containing protein [Musa troglodytarum]|uniref:RhoGAP domain containing protein n=1 Tax=Musa troglodytarum TaxID=320322 RepID=A0A9E7KB70_9LILI|nr:rhoGAP domain containing protein [Musa troglodytarum]